jgi:hypothetical protein
MSGPNLSRWVRGEGIQLSGRNYVGAIGVRAGSLWTAARGTRSSSGSPLCDCCGVYDSLGHRMQVCSKTWAMRISRHNFVVAKLQGILEKYGYVVHPEPHIPTSRGLRKPDLVASRNGTTLVIDGTIVSDNAVLDLEHQAKVTKDDVLDIREYVAALTQVKPSAVLFTALVFNWRGAMSRASYESSKKMGLSDGDCELLSVATLEHGYRLYVHSQRCTKRCGSRGPYRPGRGAS